uniref:DNA-directed RNA polymerase subunit 5 n=1 Tax=Pithovirus LCPAC404 TaxID=2506597 RepID=A0A481ZEX8_9VIRU|nr:MAG: DNA-directed RNA polymerase subunit 5 [Pithovirus LCPAC404]
MMRRQHFDTEVEDNLEFFARYNKNGMLNLFSKYYIEKADSERTSVSRALSRLYVSDKGVKKYCYYMNKSLSATGDVLVDQMRKLLSEITITQNIVIIAPNKLGSDVASVIKDLPSYTFTSFLHKELLYDPFDSYLVPEHVLLSKEEGIKLLEELKIDIDDLPDIRESDPPAKRLAAARGDIIKITREIYDVTALVTRTVMYRKVTFTPNIRRK